jgi:hypothetical protein
MVAVPAMSRGEHRGTEMDRNRLEWAADVVEIQQLAYRYAISADSKDPETMASLYAETAISNGFEMTRPQLVEKFARSFSGSPQSILNVGNHLVERDPDDPDRATGTVYCRCEAEVDGEWLVQQIVYMDSYVRENGAWRFANRKHLLFYGALLGQSPVGLPPSDAAELTDGKGSMPQIWPSYRQFWEGFPDRKHY